VSAPAARPGAERTASRPGAERTALVRELGGRREAALLELPSVRRMAEVLARRCREPSWPRTLVPALDRFGRLTGHDDLEALLAAARADPAVAVSALADLAGALRGQPAAAVAGLGMAPKVWFRLGGVAVPWRPLPSTGAERVTPALRPSPERLVLLALVGSGLHLAELLRVRVGDLGSVDEAGRVLADPEAEPLAVAFQQRKGKVADRLTFLTWPARQAVLDELARRRRQGLPVEADAPLVAGPDGGPATYATVASARRRAAALIQAGSRVNLELCRTTGEFFRAWGLPGSRFVPTTTQEASER
jgi:hypothetical protein